MSTETIGETLRNPWEEKELSLCKVAALLDIDVAILGKMKRGERKPWVSVRPSTYCSVISMLLALLKI